MMYTYNGPDNARFNLLDLNKQAYQLSEVEHNCYKVIWAKSDTLNLGVDGYRVHLKMHQLLFATPLNTLDIDEHNKDIVIYKFNREFYCIRDHDSEVSCNGFLFLGSSTPITVDLALKEQKSFELLYQFFIEEFSTVDHIQGEMLLVLLKRMLIKSVRIARKSLLIEDMPQPKLDIIRRFNLLVEMHFREKHQVSQYAEMLHVTPKSLSNLFLKYYTKAPLKVINERILLESRQLLRLSNKNTTEIAYSLGFSSVSHFSKFFKKQTGIAPSNFVAAKAK